MPGWVHAAELLNWPAFVAIFLGVAIWETFRPLGKATIRTGRRWANHWTLYGATVILSWLLLRGGAVGAALWASHHHFGILPRLGMPVALQWIVAILLLDLVLYWTHWSFHHVSFLWRIHEVHHSDPDYDVSTALRFHPLETLPVEAVYAGVILVLAPPPGAVALSELMVLAVNLVVHANASLPAPLDRALRLLFVTPDMHRIHHSREIQEQSRNLGQKFAFWDRMFGTYLGQALNGRERIVTGLRGFDGDWTARATFLIAEPFGAYRRGPSENAKLPFTASAQNQQSAGK